MKELFVRVHPKAGVERFFRCGMEFTKAWKPVEVDAATEQRLEEEQMLETSETDPTGQDSGASGDGSGTSDGQGTATVIDPEWSNNAAELLTQVIEAADGVQAAQPAAADAAESAATSTQEEVASEVTPAGDTSAASDVDATAIPASTATSRKARK